MSRPFSQSTIGRNWQSSSRRQEKMVTGGARRSLMPLMSLIWTRRSPYSNDGHPLFEDAGLTEQLALFPQATAVPEGLQYVAEFISPELERELIGHVSALPLQPFQFGAFEGKRRVASFGFRYDYTLQRLQPAEPIPPWLLPLIKKVETHDGPPTQIAQVLCTEYDVGVGIGWHRDKPHFDRIFGLSLGSPCKLRFRRAVGEKWQRHTLEAAPRSLYMMSGESRRVWEHSIPAVEAPRYSITFRTMAERKA
jgi:alkylated DNA repair dioxygenase AlkB